MKHVPKCCSLKWKEHKDMIFCYGVIEEMEKGIVRKQYRCICDMSRIKEDRDKFKDIMKETVNDRVET